MINKRSRNLKTAFRLAPSLVGALAVAAVLAEGVLFYRSARQQAWLDAEAELQTIAQFKADQLVQWRAERLGDDSVIMDSAYFSEGVATWMETKSPADMEKLLRHLRSTAKHDQYRDVLLADANGQVLLSVTGHGGDRLHEEAVQALGTALRRRRVMLSELHRGDDVLPIHLSAIAPIFAGDAKTGEPLGAVILQCNAEQYLYPLIRSWPVPSASGETVFFRRDGDDVLFLSPLRFQLDAALNLRVPLTRTDVPAVMAVLGRSGVMEGKDYRGVEVLSFLLAVPDSPWFLVVKQDTAEVFAPLRQTARATAAVVALLILTLVLAFGFVWYQRVAAQKVQLLNESLEQRVLERTTELRQSESRFKALADTSPLAIYLSVGIRQQATYINPTFVRLFGYELAEIPSVEEWWPLAYPDEDYARQVKEEWQRRAAQAIAAQSEIEPMETVVACKNGSRKNILWGFKAIGDENWAFGLDLTERKRVETDLQDSKRRLVEVQKMAQLGHWSWDVKTGNVDWSEEVYHIFRLDPESYTPRIDSILALSPWPEENARDQELIQKAMESHKKGEYEQRFLRPDQSIGFYHSTFQGQYDDEGELIAIVGTVMDITGRKQAAERILQLLAEANASRRTLLSVVEDQKQAEEKIRALNDELEQRVIARTAQLEVANQELEAFSYSVSHDLRAPLRAIDGFSHALQEDLGDQLDETCKDHLKRVRAAAQHMALLIDDLLQLSRLSREPLNRCRMDLSALVQGIAENLQAADPSRHVELLVAENVQAEADPALIAVVLENLLGNAWKFTSKTSPARIEFGRVIDPSPSAASEEAARNRSVFFVRDNGAGFEMQYAKKLFGAFQRLHSTAEFPGTGIGLATVARIIHRHGGEVWAEGAVNQGATFCFTLEQSARPINNNQSPKVEEKK